MITSGNQNQFPSSFAHLGDLLKALMFLLNLNSFHTSPSLPDQGFARRKGSSNVWKEKGSKWFCHFFSLSLSCFCFALLVCFALFFFWVRLIFMLFFVLFNMFLFGFVFHFFFIFFSYKNKNKNWKIRKIQKQCVFCVLVYLGWPLKQIFLNFVFLVT